MDIRKSYFDLQDELRSSEADVLFVGIPSTFAPQAHIDAGSSFISIDSQNVRYTKSGLEMYGDQDHEPNHGIFYATAYLNSAGTSTAAIDLNMSYYIAAHVDSEIDPILDLVNAIKSLRPKILAFSSMTPNIEYAKYLAKVCAEQIESEYLALLGGIATSDPEACVDSCFDAIILGDAEDAISEILNDLYKKENWRSRPFVYGGTNYVPSQTPKRSVAPDYSYVPLEVPLIPRLFFSHGCGAKCGFCAPAAYFGYKVHMRSPEDFIEDVTTIHHLYDFEWFLIGDLTFFITNNRTKDVMSRLAELNIKPWWCQTQARYLNFETATNLKQAGCKQVAIGFEDLESEEKEIRFKNSGLEASINICRTLKEIGISVQSYWMFGMPKDTLPGSITKINQMIMFARNDLVDAFHITYLIPYPGTPYVVNNEVEIEHSNYGEFLGTQGGYYNTAPMHRTENLSRDVIYLLTRSAVHAVSQELSTSIRS